MKCFCGKKAAAKISRSFKVIGKGKECLCNPGGVNRYDYLCECHTERMIHRMFSFGIEHEVIYLEGE